MIYYPPQQVYKVGPIFSADFTANTKIHFKKTLWSILKVQMLDIIVFIFLLEECLGIKT